MRRFILAVFAIMVSLLYFQSSAYAGGAGLSKEFGTTGDKIQTFTPDPGKSQVTSAMTGTVTFKIGSGGTVDITNWIAIKIRPSADSTYYYNTDTTKTYALTANTDSIIMVNQTSTKYETPITQVVVVLGAATAYVQGM
jgi:hypothetical protein